MGAQRRARKWGETEHGKMQSAKEVGEKRETRRVGMEARMQMRVGKRAADKGGEGGRQ